MVTSQRQLLLLRICAAVAIVFSLVQTIAGAWIYSETLDEPFHLGWNRRFVNEGITERESVYNYISTTPILVLNVYFQRAVQPWLGEDRMLTLFLTRLPNVVWLFGIMLATFLLTRWAGGVHAAYLALIGVSLDPNIIAHSSLATVDASYTFGYLITLAALIWYARKRTFLATIFVGLALGLTLVSKFTGLFLVIAFFTLPLVYPKFPELNWRNLIQRSLELAVILVVTCIVICIGYQFHEVGFRFADVRFFNRMFRGVSIAFPNLRLPLPFDFVSGIDHLLEAGARDAWNVIFMGEWYKKGIWSYFLVAWLLKTPFLLLLGQIAGFTKLVTFGELIRIPVVRFIALNLGFFLIYFSFFFSMQVGYRYILMCVPLMYILGAVGLSRIRFTRRHFVSLSFVTVLIVMLEVGMYYGNTIAFTNLTFWPKKNAFRILADSNIDWGQNRWRLPEIMQNRGIEKTHQDPLHILPGHNTLGLNTLAGVFWNFEQHKWLRENLDPDGHYRHTYLWFDISDDEFDKFLTETRTLEAHSQLQKCANEPENSAPLGVKVLNFTSAKQKTVCLVVQERSKIRFLNRRGEAKFGPLGERFRCETEMVYGEKESWYVLEPGTHEFCVEATRASVFSIETKDGEVRHWIVD